MTSPYPEDIAQETQVSAVDRAREALAAAQEAPTYVSLRDNGGHDPENALTAIRDAQVASGQATLAVAEVIQELASTVSSAFGVMGARVTDAERIVSEDITEVCTELSELCTEVSETRAIVDSLAGGTAESAVAELRDIAGSLAVLVDRVDRPRWWQWRRRAIRARAERVIPAEVAWEVTA